MTWLYIGIAGAVGALARLGLSMLLNGGEAALLPWGTLLTNWLGCFILGWLAYSDRVARHPKLKAALTTGLIGSFTTFSTLSWELLQYVTGRLWLHAFLYVLASAGGGLLFVRLGREMIFRLSRKGTAG
ncbi:fluoride efflux transporter FluC [Paenibacillus puerhi]|uniref:fluoride efflux transporter FluC n=1 Tax=Paenibacillus puerhi TaxID=2692622 RepID=UPI00135B310C|nr:CrcB family protein [Paenibacillus puerhi]